MNLSKNEDTKARILGYHQAHQTSPVSPHTSTARLCILSEGKERFSRFVSERTP